MSIDIQIFNCSQHSRTEIFQRSSVAVHFTEKVLIGIKNRFLLEDSENPLKRSAILYLLCKIYFTDDFANKMKLRITCDEWNKFREYIESIKELEAYEAIRIMFYHLLTENFFRFTVKTQALALDYGTPQNELSSQHDSTQDIHFWNEIRNDIRNLENSDVVDLINLNAIREEAVKPFKDMLPERGLLSEALIEFEIVKQLIQKPTEPAPSRITLKQVSESCRDFLKTSGVGSAEHRGTVSLQQMDFEEDDSEPSMATKKKSKRRKAGNKTKAVSNSRNSVPELSSSDSASEKDYKRMTRSLGFNSQNVMSGIGASKHFSERLKKCYGKIE